MNWVNVACASACVQPLCEEVTMGMIKTMAQTQKPPLKEPSILKSFAAQSHPDGRLSAPSAGRNASAICDVLKAHLPQAARVLEVASGTGEHAIHMVKEMPHLLWQPTDIAPARRASIDAWRVAEALDQIAPARPLDAGAPEWNTGSISLPVDAVVVVNLLHLLPKAAARNVIHGAARALSSHGQLFLYGPFKTQGSYRSDGDASFDAKLRAEDETIGYKDAAWIAAQAAAAGFEDANPIEMPANNLMFAFRRL